MILLVSVSARMLAELATRDGHDVIAFDRFGDLDLQRVCPSVSLQRDLGGHGGMEALVDAAEKVPAAGVVYGAGLENRPDLVARLAAGRTLLGCTPETLRRVRDPAVLGASLRAATVELYLGLLAAVPDTLVARKRGRRAAERVSAGAASVLAAGGVRGDAGRAALQAFDASLRRDGNALNPGTTADVVTAILFVALLEGLP